MLLKRSQLKHFSVAFLGRFTAAVFILVSVFGIFICTNLFMNMAMPMEQAMESSHSLNCVFGMNMAESTLCPMSAVEHISSWQQFFTAVIPSDLLGLLALLLVIAVAVFSAVFAPSSTSPPLTVVRLALYYKQHWSIKLYNYFLHIFARGIIQPKIFA